MPKYTVRVHPINSPDPHAMSEAVYIEADSPASAIVDALCRTDHCHGGDYRVTVEVFPFHHDRQSPDDLLAEETLDVAAWCDENKQVIADWFRRQEVNP